MHCHRPGSRAASRSDARQRAVDGAGAARGSGPVRVRRHRVRLSRLVVREQRFLRGERGIEFELDAGDGCYIPYQWPHWVKTKDSHSISMAITWKTEEVRRLNDLHRFNSMLRSLGMPQTAPGKNPAFDAVKLGLYRTAAAVVEPLRGSETMRRIIRRIALGKNANYYLKKA